MPLKPSQIARLIEKVNVYLQDNVDKFSDREEYDILEDRLATIRYDFYSVGMAYDFPAIMMDLRSIIGKIGAVRNNPIKVKTRGITGGKSRSEVRDGLVVIYADEETAKTIRETFRVNHGVTPVSESPITYKVGEVNRLIHYGFIDAAVGSQKRKRTSSALDDIFDFDNVLAPPSKRRQAQQAQQSVVNRVLDLDDFDLNFAPSKEEEYDAFNFDFDEIERAPSIGDFDELADTDVQDLQIFLETDLELPGFFGVPQGPPADDTEASYYFTKTGPCRVAGRDVFDEFGMDLTNFSKFRAYRNVVVYMDYLWNQRFIGSIILGGSYNVNTDAGLQLFLSNRNYTYRRRIVSNTVDVLGDGRLRASLDTDTNKSIMDDLVELLLYSAGTERIYITLFLDLSAASRHANVLVIDKTNKKLIRFEPHGAMCDPGTRIYNPMKVDAAMVRFAEMYLSGYTYVKPSDYLPVDGVQIKEVYNNNFDVVRDKLGRLREAGGYCMAWTYLFIWVFNRSSNQCNAKEAYNLVGHMDADELAILIRRVMHYIYTKTKEFK